MSQSINALDLTKDVPRSPRVRLGKYVIGARVLDKCRAVIAETSGEYHFDCPLDQVFFQFTGIDSSAFRDFVATGADDEAVINWVSENSAEKSDEEIVQWNNDLRDKRISEMPIELQIFIEGYIPENLPAGRVVYHWFDIYDIEEGRLQSPLIRSKIQHIASISISFGPFYSLLKHTPY